MQTKQTFLAALTLLTCTTASLAQMGPPMRPGEQRTTVEAYTIQTLPASLNDGGEFSAQDYALRIGSSWGLNSGSSIGLGLGYGYQKYDFKDAIAPWENIHYLDFGIRYTHQIDETQAIFLLPRIQFAYEDGAGFGDAARYGGIAAYTKRFNQDLMLGLGGALFTGMEETTAFPLLFIYWQINENWRVANPFRPGPSSNAGLELVYTGLEKWEFSAGSGYRTDRFALSDQNLVPEGYGENSGAVVFLRSTYNINRGNSLDLYAATMLGGELKLEDSRGSEISSSDYDPSLILALAYSLRF